MRHTLRSITAGFAIAALCMTVGGCTLLSPREVKPEKSLLNETPLELPHEQAHEATVLVLPPETAAVYDTTRMAYSTQPHDIGYFTQREWGETPSQMLQPLLVKTLENTHSFGAIVVPPYTGRYTYTLHTEILELVQDFTSQPATLVLTLRFRLTDDGAGQTTRQRTPNPVPEGVEGASLDHTWSREVAVRQPMRQETSYSGVVAANEATAKALRQMAAFVLQQAADGSRQASSR